MNKKLKHSLLLSIYILGYTSLSFELIILRQFVNFVGSNTLITSIIMAFILMFLSLGYYLGSVIRFSKHPIRKNIIKTVYCLSGWYILACSFPIIGSLFYILYSSGITSATAQVTIMSLILLIFPSVGLGFITSVIGRIVHHSDSNYTGRFMAVDTLGSVSGSLLTTLFFMPLLGVYAATTLLVFLTACVLLLLSPSRKKIFSLSFVVLITAAALFSSNEKLLQKDSSLVLDDAVSRIEIVETDQTDGEFLSKQMFINGSNSSKISKKDDLMFGYINYINNTFINTLPADKVHNILVLGAGGFTAGKDDTRNNYVYLDVVKNLKQISEDLFLDEPLTKNKTFIAQDAYLFMLKDKKKYDLILVDVYSAQRNIPVNFVTADFFEMVKNHLEKNGVMLVNIITSPSFKNKYAARLDNTLRSVFPHYLSRQIIAGKRSYNPYADDLRNIIYTYYNYPYDNGIYTLNKNSAVFGQ